MDPRGTCLSIVIWLNFELCHHGTFLTVNKRKGFWLIYSHSLSALHLVAPFCVCSRRNDVWRSPVIFFYRTQYLLLFMTLVQSVLAFQRIYNSRVSEYSIFILLLTMFHFMLSEIWLETLLSSDSPAIILVTHDAISCKIYDYSYLDLCLILSSLKYYTNHVAGSVAGEDVKMASFVDEINAYTYLYPMELPSKKFLFKWLVSYNGIKFGMTCCIFSLLYIRTASS